MSSPLASLRKNRRVPLPHSLSDGTGISHTDCSDTDYQGIFSQNQPAAEVTEKKFTVRSKLLQTRTVKEAPPSNFELMSSMIKKICLLEKKLKTQAMDLKQKTQRIAVLEEKLKVLQETKALKKTVENENQDKELEELCHSLQNQVWEMKKFLSDYGMIWVGSNEEVPDEVNSQCSATPSASKGFKMNFDLVMQNIRDLNLEAGEGESQVVAVPGGAKLTQKASIPLRLYRNGIVLFEGPFRSYQEPNTQEFMRDLMDGFFPSELQERFPNGVPFQVHDRTCEDFIVRRSNLAFPGKGQTVAGALRQCTDRSDEGNLSLQIKTQISGKTLSVEKFLQKLPETVVKRGKTISIRNSVKAHLLGIPDGAESHSVIVVDTTAQEDLKTRETACFLPVKDITTLRVKSEDGMNTFLLNMYFTDTIGDLRHFLDTHRAPSASTYDIISTFPHRCYSDESQTLIACGLHPNVALLLRPHTSIDPEGSTSTVLQS